jgi:hypothetical protein
MELQACRGLLSLLVVSFMSFLFTLKIEWLRLGCSELGGFYFCIGLLDLSFLNEVGFDFLS